MNQGCLYSHEEYIFRAQTSNLADTVLVRLEGLASLHFAYFCLWLKGVGCVDSWYSVFG